MEIIQNSSKKEKTRHRLEYLLRKVSDSQSLDAALRKTKEKFGLSGSQMARLLHHLKTLGINPITLSNASKYAELPCLLHLI